MVGCTFVVIIVYTTISIAGNIKSYMRCIACIRDRAGLVFKETATACIVTCTGTCSADINRRKTTFFFAVVIMAAAAYITIKISHKKPP